MSGGPPVPTELFSLRMNKETLARLAARSRETGESKSRLAQRYIEEGLRMEAHPGIYFQDGPGGRRAVVRGGPDVWQVISITRRFDGTPDDIVRETMNFTGLDERRMNAVVRYYAEYRDEIDEWVRRNDEIGDRHYAQWLREQAVLAR
jgi:hypothetical protein